MFSRILYNFGPVFLISDICSSSPITSQPWHQPWPSMLLRVLYALAKSPPPALLFSGICSSSPSTSQPWHQPWPSMLLRVLYDLAKSPPPALLFSEICSSNPSTSQPWHQVWPSMLPRVLYDLAQSPPQPSCSVGSAGCLCCFISISKDLSSLLVRSLFWSLIHFIPWWI